MPNLTNSKTFSFFNFSDEAKHCSDLEHSHETNSSATLLPSDTRLPPRLTVKASGQEISFESKRGETVHRCHVFG